MAEEYKDLLCKLHYHKGFLIFNETPEEFRHISALVVRCENDTLLMRIDAKESLIKEEETLEFAIPGENSLYIIEGLLKQIRPIKWDMVLVSLEVLDIKVMQRRTDKRFETSLVVQFFTQSVLDSGTKNYGEGKVLDISLGGMQLETTNTLPKQTPILFFVWSPVGSMHMEGKVVTERAGALGQTFYGIEFTYFDNITSYRLNKHIHMMSQTNHDQSIDDRLNSRRHRF